MNCFLFIRKKRGDHKVTSEPITITNKAASDEMDQQNNEAGKQQAVEQPALYETPVTRNDRSTTVNKNTSTVTIEQIEMQEGVSESVTIANKLATDDSKADQQNNEVNEKPTIQQNTYEKLPKTSDSLTEKQKEEQ